MKYLRIATISMFISCIIMILLYNPTNTTEMKYIPDEHNFKIVFEYMTPGETYKYKLNEQYKIKFEILSIIKNELTYNVYVNDNLVTKTKIPNYYNGEFHTEDFYLYGKTLVYFTKNTKNKYELFMYFINKDDIKKMPIYIDNNINDLRLTKYKANKDHLTVIYSRIDQDYKMMYDGINYNICKGRFPKNFDESTIIEEYYNYNIVDEKLSETPILNSKYDFQEYKTNLKNVECNLK